MDQMLFLMPFMMNIDGIAKSNFISQTVSSHQRNNEPDAWIILKNINKSDFVGSQILCGEGKDQYIRRANSEEGFVTKPLCVDKH